MMSATFVFAIDPSYGEAEYSPLAAEIGYAKGHDKGAEYGL